MLNVNSRCPKLQFLPLPNMPCLYNPIRTQYSIHFAPYVASLSLREKNCCVSVLLRQCRASVGGQQRRTNKGKKYQLMMEARTTRTSRGYRFSSPSFGDNAIPSSPSYGPVSYLGGDASLRCFLSAHSRLAFLERSAASSRAALAVTGLSLISQLFLSLMLALSCA